MPEPANARDLLNRCFHQRPEAGPVSRSREVVRERGRDARSRSCPSEWCNNAPLSDDLIAKLPRSLPEITTASKGRRRRSSAVAAASGGPSPSLPPPTIWFDCRSSSRKRVDDEASRLRQGFCRSLAYRRDERLG